MRTYIKLILTWLKSFSMRTISLLVILLISSLVSSSQVIQLKFTALLNGSHVNLDSVRISNLTHPGDTVLHWPDTSLLLGYVGIQDVADNQHSAFDIRLGSSNPCIEKAVIQLYAPANDKVDFIITDVSGRLKQKISRYLVRGVHCFLYSPDKQGVSIVSVSFKSEVKSLKIVYAGPDRGNVILEYWGSGSIIVSGKSKASSQGFVFVPGDSLLLKGWYNGNSIILPVAPQLSSSYTFGFGYTNYCPGLPLFTYGGQVYHTVQIGNQCWMRENLNIGIYVQSTSGSSHSDLHNNGIIEKYCYDNNLANCAIYGGLYDWDEIMQYDTTPGLQGICPPGWHIPTHDEWDTLVSFVGGGWAGGKVKETGFVHWHSPNSGATNESGFTAFGGGGRNMWGAFTGLLDYAHFWSSSQYISDNPWEIWLDGVSTLFSQSTNYKYCGYSLRCFKD